MDENEKHGPAPSECAPVPGPVAHPRRSGNSGTGADSVLKALRAQRLANQAESLSDLGYDRQEHSANDNPSQRQERNG